MSNDYLVYEHWRPDTDRPFYVGKGKKKRAHSLEPRNSLHGRIIAKLLRAGLSPIIKIVKKDLAEKEAFALEIKLIRRWRTAGFEIANFTDGGDGTSGYRFTDEQRDKIRVKATGRIISPETRAKMSASRTGQRRSPETKERMRQAALRVQSKSRKAICLTEKGRAQMLEMARKAASDPAIRAARSVNAKVLWADPAYREKVLAARCVPKSVVKGFS